MENVPLLSERNILDRRRTTTDVILFCIFSSLFVLWFGIVVYAYIAGDSLLLFPPEYVNKSKILFNVSRIFVIIGYIMLAGFYTMLFFIAMRYISNFSYVTFLVIWIPIASSIVSTIIYKSNNNFSNIYSLCGSLCSFILILILINTEWFYLPEKIIKESCKFVLTVPSTLLFSLICYLLCIAIGAVTITVHFYLSTPSANIATFRAINIICGCWTFLMVIVLQQMVLYGTYTILFWIPNKEEVTARTILRYLKLILKYHTGTIAYGTSFLGVIVSLCLLIRRAVGKLLVACSAKVVFFIICNIFDPILLKFMIIGTFVKCATHGKGYYQTTVNAYEYFDNYPRRCLVVFKVIEYTITFATVTVTLLMSLSLLDYLKNLPSSDTNYDWQAIFSVPVALGSLLFFYPLISSLVAACYAIFFCFLEDLEENDGSEARPYAMSEQLRSVIDNPGPPSWYRKCRTCGAASDEDVDDDAA